MSDEQTIYQKLAAPFDLADHAKVNKGSGSQTYAPWTSYVERLNDVLAADWSFRIVREGFTATECWVLGEITAVIDGVTVTRQQYGCEPITKGQRETPTADLLKTAASDAIKKAASLLGPGLYLSIKEEREKVEAEMRAAVQAEAQRQAEERAAKNKPKPTPINDKARDSAVLTGAAPRPAVSKERFDLEKAYRDGMTYADSIGLTPEDLDVAALDDAALREVVAALREQCRFVLAEKKKGATA